jgi:hypothetical protein
MFKHPHRELTGGDVDATMVECMDKCFDLGIGRQRILPASGQPVHERTFDLCAALHDLQGVQGTDQLTAKSLSVNGSVMRGTVSPDDRPRTATPLRKPLDEVRAADVLIVIEGFRFKINRFVKNGFEGRFHDRVLMVFGLRD